MPADPVGRGDLLVREVAAPVLGDDIRVNQRTDRSRGHREVQLIACEAFDVPAEVGVGFNLPILLHPEEETRGGRVLVLRRNSRPDLLQIDDEELEH